jgi:thiamine pyrophosphokinase
MPAEGTSVSRTAVVVIGGQPPPSSVRPVLGRLVDPLVVAADSGVDHALALGLRPAVVVGDLDSVSPAGLRRARELGASVERHPAAKDATDAELAIDVAVARGAHHVVVVTGGGGRLDHELGGLLLLGLPRFAGVTVSAWWGTAHIDVLHGPATRTLTGRPGALVSLLALHGDARGVSCEGLAYPLHDEALLAGSSRGVSNVFTDERAEVTVRHGTILAVQPDALAGGPGPVVHSHDGSAS